MNQSFNVCLVHDWLTGMRGGEKVLETFCELFPQAPIYTLFCQKEKLSETIRKHPIHVSFLQYLPGIIKIYQWMLPLFPLAIRSFYLNKYDLVISTSHCVAKSVRTNRSAIHICYCFTPARYAWGFFDEYFEHHPAPLKWLMELYLDWFCRWDHKTAQDITHFIADSQNVADRISQYYKRNSVVIYPPLDREYRKSESQIKDYYLYVGALVPYKRADLAVQAFNQLKRPLRIVGDGSARTRFENLSKSKEIVFEGWLNDKDLSDRYANARALIFPGEEDFGIVPLEAQAFGKPVIAYGKGGVLETVLPHTGHTTNAKQATGLFFHAQTADALIEAVKRFESLKFDSHFTQAHVQKFKKGCFKDQFAAFLRSVGVVPKPQETVGK
jgi:glycosyltransferase involved in cell wall biosynthesis